MHLRILMIAALIVFVLAIAGLAQTASPTTGQGPQFLITENCPSVGGCTFAIVSNVSVESIRWSFGDGTVCDPGNNPPCKNWRAPKHYYAKPGAYFIQAVVKYSCKITTTIYECQLATVAPSGPILSQGPTNDLAAQMKRNWDVIQGIIASALVAAAAIYALLTVMGIRIIP